MILINDSCGYMCLPALTQGSFSFYWKDLRPLQEPCHSTDLTYEMADELKDVLKGENPKTCSTWGTLRTTWPKKRKKKKYTYSTKYCRNSVDSYGRRSTTVVRIRMKQICDNHHKLEKILSSFGISYVYILKLDVTHITCEVALHKSFHKHFCLKLGD